MDNEVRPGTAIRALWAGIFLTLLLHPDPNEARNLSLGVNGAALLVALCALRVSWQGAAQPLSLDLWDVLLAAAGGICSIASGRIQHISFAASLIIARKVIQRGVPTLPMGLLCAIAGAAAAITLKEVIPGRFSLPIGDPNFTAAIALIFLLALIQYRAEIAVRVFPATIIAIVIALSGSRMGALCFLAAVVIALIVPSAKPSKMADWLYRGQFLASLLGPMLAAAAFVGGLAFSNVENADQRILHLEDSSNFDRVVGYLYALDFINSDPARMLGDDNYVEGLPSTVALPHNWVLGSLVKYGIWMSVVAVGYVYRLGGDLHGRAKALFGTYVLAAGTLNIGILNGLFVVSVAAALAQSVEVSAQKSEGR